MSITVVVPVMTLNHCVFLPQQLMPLRIFEPRYRKMLKSALAGNQMFAISQLDESRVSIENDEPPCPFTCVGRIAGHVELADGSTHLILEGMRRARVMAVAKQTPYPCIEIAPVIDESQDDSLQFTREIARVLALSEKLLAEAGSEAEPLIERLRGLSNKPGALADAAAGHLIADTQVRRTLLECLSPLKRISTVAHELSHLIAQKELEDKIRPINPDLN